MFVCRWFSPVMLLKTRAVYREDRNTIRRAKQGKIERERERNLSKQHTTMHRRKKKPNPSLRMMFFWISIWHPLDETSDCFPSGRDSHASILLLLELSFGQCVNNGYSDVHLSNDLVLIFECMDCEGKRERERNHPWSIHHRSLTIDTLFNEVPFVLLQLFGVDNGIANVLAIDSLLILGRFSDDDEFNPTAKTDECLLMWEVGDLLAGRAWSNQCSKLLFLVSIAYRIIYWKMSKDSSSSRRRTNLSESWNCIWCSVLLWATHRVFPILRVDSRETPR